MNYYDTVTPRQRATIEKIERYLGIRFEGKYKGDATEYISEWLDESYKVSKEPITASQAGKIAEIVETLAYDNVEFKGTTYGEAADFICQYTDEVELIKKHILSQKETKPPKEIEVIIPDSGTGLLKIGDELISIEDACGECGTRFKHQYEKYYHLDKPIRLCTSCYHVYSKSKKYQEKEQAVNPASHLQSFSTQGEKAPARKAKKAPVKVLPEEIQKAAPKQKPKPEKRGKCMFNMKSIMGEFGKVTDGQFKLSFQGLAVRTAEDSYAVYDEEEHRMIDVMDFVADAEGMIYKMPAQIDQLEKGDIIIVKNKPLVVKSVNGNSIRALNPISNNETTHKPAGNMFGIQFITKVVSMFELMQNPQGGQGFNPMMLMFMSKDSDSDSKMSDLLPLMLMGGQGGQMNNMLPFLLMSGKGDGEGGMMEMLMMSQMMGGQQGGFNFGNLFGATAPTRVEPAPATEPALDANAIAKQVFEMLQAANIKPADETSAE